MENSKKDWKEDFGKGCFDVFKAAFSPWSQRVENEDGESKTELIDPVNIKLFKIVGDGGQAYVYRASWKNSEVACKIFKNENEASMADLKKLLKLKHENIISLKGIVERFPSDQLKHSHIQGPGLVMEFCKMTLQEVIQSQRIPIGPTEILTYATEMCKGMKYLHSKRIIHRDLKSANILVGFDNKLKISDLDSHTLANPEESAKISVRGTPNWMAPELIRAEKCSDKVDIWSFGVIIWELVTREEPYKNLNSNQIIFGVGSNRLKLLIPCRCSPVLASLMTSCWKTPASARPSFSRLEKMIQHAEMDLEGVTIEQLEDDRCKWRREINTALEDYKSAKEESTKTRVEEDWEEVAKLREKLEKFVSEKITSGDLSPECITQSFVRMPSSIRLPIMNKIATSVSPPDLNSPPTPSSGRRSNRRRRAKKPPSTFGPNFGHVNTAFQINYSDHEGENEGESSDDELSSRIPRISSGLRAKSFHHIRTADSLQLQREASSSDDANISSASPHSSTSENEESTDSCLSDTPETPDISDLPVFDTQPVPFNRQSSIDEGFFSSRGPSLNEKAATLDSKGSRVLHQPNRNNPFRNSSPV